MKKRNAIVAGFLMMIIIVAAIIYFNSTLTTLVEVANQPPSVYVDIAMVSSAGFGGTIEPGFLLVQPGQSITYTITPTAGYQISNVTVDGISQGAITKYTFTNIQTNHNISASFTLVSPLTSSSPSTSSPTPTTVKTSLSNAISSGLVQASFSGTGSCSGDCMILNIKRLVSYTVEIEPPALGTSLTTSGNAQNMVVLTLQGISHGATYTPTSSILLTDSNSVAYVFRAYCLDFHKSNPASSDQFSVSGTANSDVIKILNALSGLSTSVASTAAVQTAIWVVTDNVNLQELRSIFPSGASQLENVKTILAAAGIDMSGKQLFSPTSATPTPP